MFPRYLQYLLTDFRQTFVTGASRDRDNWLDFGFKGSKFKVTAWPNTSQIFMFPLYLQYLLIDFCQTFVTGASWDTDDLITFLGQKVKVQGHTIAAEAHSTRRYRQVQLFSSWDSIWGVRFDSRILASCRSTVESPLLRLEMLWEQNAEAADWLTATHSIRQAP